VSLDESDNDLREFLTYFLAAIKSAFPSVSLKTQSLLQAADLPPVKVLSRFILNDLDRLETPLILVLDDYHLIKENVVHDLLRELLHHPSPILHIALLTRRDPPLPLTHLRAYNQLTEMTVEDLRFTLEETSSFLERFLRVTLDADTASVLEARVEGWVAGLRLAALSLRQKEDHDRILQELRDITHFVQGYLIEEVLSHIPKAFARHLMETSILDRFCAPLCDVLHSLFGDQLEADEELSGQAFIHWLEETRMFVTSLDNKGQWFRYHHLFQQLLQDQLKKHRNPDEVAALYSRASDWFVQSGLIEEAIQCSMEAGDVGRAAKIIESNRHAAFNADRWYSVEKWLAQLPEECVQESPELLLTKARVQNIRGRLMEIPPLIGRVEQILKGKSAKPELLGELNFAKGFLSFWAGERDLCLKYCRKALSQIPEDEKYDLLRGDNMLFYVIALQMAGKGEKAVRELNVRTKGYPKQQGMYLSRLVAGSAFIHLLSGDLKQAEAAALQLNTVSRRSGFSHTDSWSEYMQACCYFHLHDPDDALRYFSKAAEKKYIMHVPQVLNCLAGLSLTYQNLYQTQDADDTWEQLREFAVHTDERANVALAESTRARLSLLQGQRDSAIRWEQSFSLPLHPSSLFIWLELPHITQCRVLIATGSGDSLHKATGILQQLSKTAGAIHNIFHLVDIYALEALALFKLSQTEQALKKLEQAIDLAKPGGWIRPFIEPGPAMIDLLKQLYQQNISKDYIRQILTVFKSDEHRAMHEETSRHAKASPALESGPLSQKLSKRERDVLACLAEGLTNREIASKLFVSYVTVKKHLYNIYKKLDVHTRTAALNKSRELGIIPPD
jgi:LuxR family maltose regulon positive regulatory protein